jgi:DNA-binding NarL/FixJ family response regulator
VRDFGPTPNPRNAIRILLVDDNVVFRAGVCALLRQQRDLVVVGEAGTGEEAVVCAKATRPHVVLMDLVMPGKGGVWAMRQLTALGVRANVVVLTALSQEWELLEALEAGAHGFVEKGGPVEDLVRAIRTVTTGERFLGVDGAGLAVLQRYLKETRSST